MNQAFPQMSPMELTRRLNGDPKATVLDVRSLAEYQAGHIPGARLAPVDQLDARNFADFVDAADFRANHPLYLTCHAAKRAEKAVQVLREAGLEHVALVEGGTEASKRSRPAGKQVWHFPLAGTPGADRGGQPDPAQGDLWFHRARAVLRGQRSHRCRSYYFGHHSLVWHGESDGAHALEPPS